VLRIRETVVLLRTGVLGLDRPDRIVRLLYRLWRFGPTLAGGYATAAVKAPHRVAGTDHALTRTFAQVDRRGRDLARGLAGYGIGPDARLALLGHNSVPFVETLVATSRLGADALLLSTFLSAPQLREVLVRERPALVVADPQLLPLLAQAPAGLPVVTTRPVAGHQHLDAVAAGGVRDRTRTRTAGAALPRLPDRRRGRLVVLTSSTTGVPKGARRPAPTSLGPAASILSRLSLTAGDRIMIASPLFHTWALGILQLAPSLAASVVLRPRPDPDAVLAAVAEHGCTRWSPCPPCWNGSCNWRRRCGTGTTAAGFGWWPAAGRR
jgi:acyl-CoA synthetase (AMP-forming)/AMP-acid ligase II